MLPRLLIARRRELHEKREQLAGLVGLREQLGTQVRYIDSMSGGAPAPSYGGGLNADVNQRRERLNASIAQVESQITTARAEIDEHIRALRLLEANRDTPPRSSDRALAGATRS